MILRRIHGAPLDPEHESIEIGQPETRERIRDWYRLPRTDRVRLNLVASVSGSAVGDDGTSETLTSRVDRSILGAIRSLADVVLIGANSVRAEGYQLPRTAQLAIVTTGGDFDGHRLEWHGADHPRVIVLCPAPAADRIRESLGEASADVVAVEPGADGRLAPADIIGALRDRGLLRIVCEGGPSLAGPLLEAGLVDEICLTTSPRIGGSTLPLIADGSQKSHRLDLAQLLADDASALYARWSVLPEQITE